MAGGGQSFGEVADEYDRVRPGYPPVLVDDVLAYAGNDRPALEVGAGTGKATRAFADRGVPVVAVEPDPAMATVLARNLPRLTVVVSTFEEYRGTGFGLLYSADAWHWTRPEDRWRLAGSALAAGGALALFWNRDRIDDPALRQALLDVLAAHVPAAVVRDAPIDPAAAGRADGALPRPPHLVSAPGRHRVRPMTSGARRPQVWWRRFAVLLIVVVAGCSAGPTGGQTSAEPLIGFTATTLDGQAFDGTSLSGKPAVLWFWAPWCPICLQQAPGVRTAVETYGTRVNIIGVAGLDRTEAMPAFVRLAKVQAMTHLADEQGTVWRRFEVTAQSTFVLLDGDGTITFRGRLDADEIPDRVAALLA